MELAELLEREAIPDGEQLLDWARQRSIEVIAELAEEDSLRSLLSPDSDARIEAELDAVPLARRRRREPSSPQPKTADELPPPPEHPRLAEGEPEPILEHVDTGPIDLEDEIVRRRLREDSWALAAREVQAFVAEPEPEPEPEAPIEPAARTDSDAPSQRPALHSEPELPVVVRPAETVDEPMDTPAEDEQDEEFEVDELDEIEVDELEELEEEIGEDEDDDDKPVAAKPPRPPPPKPGPPPIRNEVDDIDIDVD
jgi:hypothetical protein